MKIRYLIVLLALLASPAVAVDCYIGEYSTLAIDANNNQIPVAGDLVNEQKMTVTTTANSTAFASGVRYIRLVCDGEKVHFNILAAPTATTSTQLLPADVIEYHGVAPGLKIAICDADCT